MKEQINIFFTKLLHSFDNTKEGLSARKLTAFAVVFVYVFSQMKWVMSCFKNNDYALLPEISMINVTFILALLGLTTWQGIKEKQLDKGPKPQPDIREPFTNT